MSSYDDGCSDCGTIDSRHADYCLRAPRHQLPGAGPSPRKAISDLCPGCGQTPEILAIYRQASDGKPVGYHCACSILVINGIPLLVTEHK